MADLPEVREEDDLLQRVDRLEQEMSLLVKLDELALERASYERTRRIRRAEIDLHLQSEQGEQWGFNSQEALLSLLDSNPFWSQAHQSQPQDGLSNTREESASRPFAIGLSPEGVANHDEPTIPLSAVESTTIEKDLEVIPSSGNVQNVSTLEPEPMTEPGQESDGQLDPVEPKTKTKSPDQTSTAAGWIIATKSLLKKICKPFVSPSLPSEELETGTSDDEFLNRSETSPSELNDLPDLPQNKEFENDVVDTASMPLPIPGQSPMATASGDVKRELPKIPKDLIGQPPPFEKPTTDSQEPSHQTTTTGVFIPNNEDAVAKNEANVLSKQEVRPGSYKCAIV